MTMWDSVTYGAQTVGWGVAGFVGGYLAGRATRDVHRIARAIPTEGTTVDEHPKRRHVSGQFVLGLVVIVLAIVTVVQGLVSGAETRRITECQSRYGNGIADALDARSSANATTQTALDQLITEIAASMQTPESPEQRDRMRGAIDRYVAQRKATNDQLQAHPLPPAPRTCE